MNKFIYCIWCVGISSSFGAGLVEGELEGIHGREILLLFKIYGGNSLAIQPHPLNQLSVTPGSFDVYVPIRANFEVFASPCIVVS